MKKLLKIVVVALIVIMTCFAFSACGNSAVGTYKISELTIGGHTYKVGEDMGGGVILTEDYEVIILKDGNVVTLSSNHGGETETQDGTWKQDGNKLTLTLSGEEPMTMECKIFDNKQIQYSDSKAAIFAIFIKK